MATSQFPAAEALRSELSEVEQTVRIFPQDVNVELGDIKFKDHAIFVDQNFFEVFSFRLLHGDLATALSKPESIILTQATAKKYFGAETAIGKNITFNGQTAAGSIACFGDNVGNYDIMYRIVWRVSYIKQTV